MMQSSEQSCRSLARKKVSRNSLAALGLRVGSTVLQAR